jgi:hypothetical protein
MLSVHLVLSTVPKTRYLRIPKLQEERVVKRHHAWTTNEY